MRVQERWQQTLKEAEQVNQVEWITIIVVWQIYTEVVHNYHCRYTRQWLCCLFCWDFLSLKFIPVVQCHNSYRRLAQEQLTYGWISTLCDLAFLGFGDFVVVGENSMFWLKLQSLFLSPWQTISAHSHVPSWCLHTKNLSSVYFYRSTYKFPDEWTSSPGMFSESFYNNSTGSLEESHKPLGDSRSACCCLCQRQLYVSYKREISYSSLFINGHLSCSLCHLSPFRV